MPPKFYKHKLLLDEGIFKRQSLRRVNNRYNIKHIKHDLHKGGIIDDFKKLAKQSEDTGIIGSTQGLTPDQLDTKLNSLLSKSSENSFFGKYTPLRNNE